MTPKTYADFEPDLGGLFDDFDSPIISAKFGPNPNAEYTAKVKDNIGLEIELDSGGERPIVQWYSIGNIDQWNSEKDGAEVVRTKNPERHAFHQKTKAYALVEKMIQHVGGGDMKKGMDVFLKRDKFMTQAEFYLGLEFHWKQQDIENPVTKEKSQVLLPDKFLGEVKYEAKKGPAAGESSELDAFVVELSEGKNAREIKQAVLKDARFAGKDAYIASIVNGTKLTELEKAGSITKGPDGKYI